MKMIHKQFKLGISLWARRGFIYIYTPPNSIKCKEFPTQTLSTVFNMKFPNMFFFPNILQMSQTHYKAVIPRFTLTEKQNHPRTTLFSLFV